MTPSRTPSPTGLSSDRHKPLHERSLRAGAGASPGHESGALHVSGEALYTDDLPTPSTTLASAIGMSAIAHGRVRTLDLSEVLTAPGVVAVLTAEDIQGQNNHGPVQPDDPIFAGDVVEYVGQSLFAVVARTHAQARQAAHRARVEYEEREPILDIATALARGSFVMPSKTLKRGDAAAAITLAPHRLRRHLKIGGQDHFYLEGQVALAIPGEEGTLQIHSSTQHTSEVQHLVAAALGLQSKDVVVECRRMGGAFGGKETQAALIACIAALAARKTGCPVKLRLDRDDDMRLTGKRHPFEVDYRVGFDKGGSILGLEVVLASNCGRSADLSDGVNVRAMFHVDNCYFLPNVEIVSHRLKLNHPSHTAFRGFGGPQGMLAIESVIEDIARYLKLDPSTVRRANYYAPGRGEVTPYGMTVADNIIQPLVTELESKAALAERRRAIRLFNATSKTRKRGLAMVPVKFGIAFTVSHLNQAGALVHVYKDGSILLNHAGTEMGQGLHTKMIQVVAEEFQVDPGRIRCSATSTSKVPNTSPTAASAGSDLNGRAVQIACETLRARLVDFAAQTYRLNAEEITFRDDRVHLGNRETLCFGELTHAAYMARVSLSATGFYKTPHLDYDPNTLKGRPFYYFCYGAAVAEVMIDTLTGESKLLRVDILHDVGKSLNPALDLGQVEGGFLQGVGWLTSEELKWNAEGELTTHAPSTYKIPTASDWPEIFNVELLSWGRNQEENLYRSKAVGEPPLMLALSVFFAIRNAIESSVPVDAAAGAVEHAANLSAPATPEAILAALDGLVASQTQSPAGGSPV